MFMILMTLFKFFFRYGRTTKTPYYSKDYLSSAPENGDNDFTGGDDFQTPATAPQSKAQHPPPARRGRPAGKLYYDVIVTSS